MKKILIVLLVLCLGTWTCESHGHSHDEPPSFKYSREANVHTKEHHQPHPPKENVWFDAIVSTLLISAAPILMLYVIPLDNTAEQQPALKVLLAFASGGLLGDAFLHLIPHAMLASEDDHDQGHSHSHTHSHGGEEHGPHDMSVGIAVLSGIVAFLMLEKCVRLIKGEGHTHSHSAVVPKPKKHRRESGDSNSSVLSSDEDSRTSRKRSKKTKAVTIHQETSHIKPAGLLNLAADFSHNFTDGLAIGASYLAGRNIGLVTTITILFHEVPHELGDFAILLQSGVSRKSAILLQLTTAIGALAGTVLSLLAQDGAFGFLASKWVLPFTAGGFIYISLVSVIPELLNDDKSTVLQVCYQIIALLTGIYMMVLIAEYE